MRRRNRWSQCRLRHPRVKSHGIIDLVYLFRYMFRSPFSAARPHNRLHVPHLFPSPLDSLNILDFCLCCTACVASVLQAIFVPHEHPQLAGHPYTSPSWSIPSYDARILDLGGTELPLSNSKKGLLMDTVMTGSAAIASLIYVPLAHRNSTYVPFGGELVHTSNKPCIRIPLIRRQTRLVDQVTRLRMCR